MVTKKQNNTTEKIVLECIEALKKAYNSPHFVEKTERGNIIIIRFDNKVEFQYTMKPEEYKQFKEIERGFWNVRR